MTSAAFTALEDSQSGSSGDDSAANQKTAPHSAMVALSLSKIHSRGNECLNFDTESLDLALLP